MKISGAMCALLLLLITATVLVSRPHVSWTSQDRHHILDAPSRLHPAGTDSLGRDRLTRLSMACLLTLGLSAAAACTTTCLAAVAGGTIGLAPAPVRVAALFGCDAILCLPLLFLFMLLRSSMPLNMTSWHSAFVTFTLLGLLSWPAGARMLAVKARETLSSHWVLQARASGVTQSRLLTRFVIPSLAPLLIAEFIITLTLFIVAEANLGLLGLGVGEPLPSLGAMLHELDDSAISSTSGWSYLPLIVLMIVMALLQSISMKKEAA